MRKLMLDCGSYDLTIVKEWLASGMIDMDTVVITFDPNPEIDIYAFRNKLPNASNIICRRDAAWTEDGMVKFWSSDRQSGAYIEGTVSNAPKKQYDVAAIDISGFISHLDKDIFIVCSMDIEGSEFPVLRKMIVDNTIDRIRVLDVEFHHRMLKNEDMASVLAILENLWKRGIAVRLKVPL